MTCDYIEKHYSELQSVPKVFAAGIDTESGRKHVLAVNRRMRAKHLLWQVPNSNDEILIHRMIYEAILRDGRLRLSMTRNDQPVIIKFLTTEGCHPDDIYSRLLAHFPSDCYSRRAVQNWAEQFRLGWESVGDLERSGRPPIDNLDQKIIHLLEENPFHSVWSLAYELAVPRSTVWRYLTKRLTIENYHCRVVPFRLSPELRALRAECCRELVSVLEAELKNNFHTIVTGDES
jgi:hypothetical protein